MKKKDAEKFAQRINDIVEEELVICGFDREFARKYLCVKKSKHFFSTLCKDLSILQNFKIKISKIVL